MKDFLMSRRSFFRFCGYSLFIMGHNFILPSAFSQTTTNEKNLNWFYMNKVQAHTRFHMKIRKKDIRFWNNANKILHNLGAKVIIRHFKTGGEGAIWYSKYSKISTEVLETKENIAKSIISDAHNLGLKIIAYYRHMEDDYLANKYPDWVCKDHFGNKQRTKRGLRLCFNSPFRNIVKGRLIELAQMGIDGFYFDEDHMPRNGCWCDYCKEKFKKEYNMNPPEKPDPQNIIWARYYVEFNNRTIEEAFIEWKRAVKQINPNIVFIISLHLYPTLLDHHLSSRLMTIADSVKSEFNIPVRNHAPEKKFFLFKVPKDYKLNNEVRIALGYTLIRDGAFGRAAHIWIPQAIDKYSSMTALSAVITYSNIANINILEDFLKENYIDFYKYIFKFNDIFSNLFSTNSLKPISLVGIYFSEKAKNKYIPKYKKSFMNVIYPTYKAFEVCFYKKIPINLYTDETIGNILSSSEKPSLIFTPKLKDIDTPQKNYLTEFMSKDGKITDNIKSFINFINNDLNFPIKLYTDKEAHYCFYINEKLNKIYIFISNKVGWLLKLNWKFYKNRKKPPNFKNYVKPIAIKISIDEKLEIDNVENILTGKKYYKKIIYEQIKYLGIFQINLKNRIDILNIREKNAKI